jgi:hypothetical protein
MTSQKYKHIHRVGIEFEGLWECLPSTSLPYIDKEDGSVEDLYPQTHEYDPEDGTCHCSQCRSGDAHVGEICSEILSPNGVTEWVDACIPTEVNASCGTHVHISSNTPGYQRYLADDHDQCIREILLGLQDISSTIYAQTVDRLESNTYCKRSDDIYNQWKGDGDRYTAINFCAMYDHDTVEFRLLPPFTRPIRASKAIHAVLAAADASIERRRRIRKQIVLDERMSFKVTCTPTKREVEEYLPTAVDHQVRAILRDHSLRTIRR